ncbi:MAG: type II toxin-antitoxin system RelE/ParE family toxin [Bacteroidales bacterium]|nr:type II toxin-antitoxin system RelE/ParE family toxin [Bacteroidales bacterium]
MNELLWTKRAVQHLENVYYYHLEFTKSEKLARKIYNDILNESLRLKEFPFIGSREIAISNTDIEYRSIIVARGLYKLIYFVDGHKVIVAVIWNCKMNPEYYPPVSDEKN